MHQEIPSYNNLGTGPGKEIKDLPAYEINEFLQQDIDKYIRKFSEDQNSTDDQYSEAANNLADIIEQKYGDRIDDVLSILEFQSSQGDGIMNFHRFKLLAKTRDVLLSAHAKRQEGKEKAA